MYWCVMIFGKFVDLLHFQEERLLCPGSDFNFSGKSDLDPVKNGQDPPTVQRKNSQSALNFVD